MSKIPGVNWYRSINRFRVENDLQKYPHLINKIPKSMKDGFIRWAANQRISFTEDIHDEIESFMRNNYAKNLAWINNKNKNNFFDEISQRDGAFCKTCRTKENLSLDHIIPRSKGGEDILDNLQILCRSCNSRKGNNYALV